MSTYKDPRHKKLSELKTEGERAFFDYDVEREVQKVIERMRGSSDFKAAVAAKLANAMKPAAPQPTQTQWEEQQPGSVNDPGSLFGKIGGGQ